MTQTLPDISPLMPMHQDPLLVQFYLPTDWNEGLTEFRLKICNEIRVLFGEYITTRMGILYFATNVRVMQIKTRGVSSLSKYKIKSGLMLDISYPSEWHITRWRHQMETFSALLAICAGNSPVHGKFPAQRPVTQSFDVNFDMHPNKRLNKQSWGWWFETPSRSLWRYCNEQDSCNIK